MDPSAACQNKRKTCLSPSLSACVKMTNKLSAYCVCIHLSCNRTKVAHQGGCLKRRGQHVLTVKGAICKTDHFKKN